MSKPTLVVHQGTGPWDHDKKTHLIQQWGTPEWRGPVMTSAVLILALAVMGAFTLGMKVGIDQTHADFICKPRLQTMMRGD